MYHLETIKTQIKVFISWRELKVRGKEKFRGDYRVLKGRFRGELDNAIETLFLKAKPCNVYLQN